MKHTKCVLFLILIHLATAAIGNSWTLANPTPNDAKPNSPFSLQVVLQNNTIEFYWQLAPKHYLYQSSIQIQTANHDNLLTDKLLPIATLVQDNVLGNYYIYDHSFSILLPYTKTQEQNSLWVTYQGCSTNGFCYPPTTQIVTLKDDIVISVQESSLPTVQNKPTKANNTEIIYTLLQTQSLPITLGTFFILGLLLAFTPCVLPMLPLVLNMILGKKNHSSLQVFLLVGCYVLAMSVTYAIAGVFAASIGHSMQTSFQQPHLLIPVVIFLIVLSLYQLELLNFKAIAWFNQKVNHLEKQQAAGTLVGTFILGILSALIISPCATPAFIGALTYISQTGNELVGGLSLWLLGLGMGSPLLAIAILGTSILPKSGLWSLLMKKLIGCTLLGLAIWLLARIVSTETTILLWGLLLVFAAIYFSYQYKDQMKNFSQRLFLITCFLLGLCGFSLIVSSFFMQYRFAPFNSFKTPGNITRFKPPYTVIHTKAEFEQHWKLALQQKKPIFLYFTASWCIECDKLKINTLFHETIVQQLVQFVPLIIDISDPSPDIQEIQKRFQVFAPPTIIVFSNKENAPSAEYIVGYLSPNDLLPYLLKK